MYKECVETKGKSVLMVEKRSSIKGRRNTYNGRKNAYKMLINGRTNAYKWQGKRL